MAGGFYEGRINCFVFLIIISVSAISAFFLIPELREIILPKPMSVEEEY